MKSFKPSGSFFKTEFFFLLMRTQDVCSVRCYDQYGISALVSQTSFHGETSGSARGGHLGIFWVGMCRPGLQIGTPF